VPSIQELWQRLAEDFGVELSEDHHEIADAIGAEIPGLDDRARRELGLAVADSVVAAAHEGALPSDVEVADLEILNRLDVSGLFPDSDVTDPDGAIRLRLRAAARRACKAIRSEPSDYPLA